MKSRKLIFITILFFLKCHPTPAQVEIKNVIPFKEGTKILSGVQDGKEIYNMFENAITKSSPEKPAQPKKKSNGIVLDKQSKQAWNEVRNLFPNQFFYSQSGSYFMMHGPGKTGICVVVFNTPLMHQIAGNYNVFNDQFKKGNYENTIAWYNQMKKEKNSEKIKEFEDKLGKLSGYFNDKESLKKLKKYLGNELFTEMMNSLRDEGKHLIDGALIHEGMHALTPNAGELQQNWQLGDSLVNFDELKAYMAEISYHCMYYNWAVGNINYHFGEIDNLLKDLEKLRRTKPEKMSDQEKEDFKPIGEKIEEIKAKIKAHIAMIRVRLREIKDSAKRINDLMVYYLSHYLNENPETYKKSKLKNPQDLVNKIKDLAAKSLRFRQDVDNVVAGAENLLNYIEGVLDEWNKFASCLKQTPPPPDTIKPFITGYKGLSFPKPPAEEARNIKIIAEEGIKGYSAGSSGQTYWRSDVYKSTQPFRFNLSGGINYSLFRMKELNNYLDYLNRTWNGNLGHIDSGTGFSAELDYSVNRRIGFGLEYEHISAETAGKLQTANSYNSRNQLNGILGKILINSDPISGSIRFFTGFSAGYYFARYHETENEFVLEGDDGQFGWKVSAGMELMVTSQFAVQFAGAYRNVRFNNFGVSFFQPGDPEATLNFSGFSGELKAVFKF